jgi:uncharacterized protein with PIN domain
MSVLYAESSAVLSWLLGEPDQTRVLHELETASHVVTSAITGIECGRALTRARHAGRLTDAQELAALRLLDDAIASWNVLDISDRVADRARGAFPREPVRTLDALHLAAAVEFADALGGVTVLSLDDRVRSNALALGLRVVPSP